jgi:thymidylate synthase
MSDIVKNEEEIQYLNLLRTIIERGTLEQTRNGNCLTIFGHQQRFTLKGGKLPILTTRKISIRIAFFELMFFIRGQTNTQYLHQNDVHIWDANSTREFLDSRGLHNYPVGELGPIYGSQWRNFNGHIGVEHGVDQLADVIRQLKNPETRSSRRIIMTAWNPGALSMMALPPCHMTCQFHVREGKYLSCLLFQRSMDTVLGCPTNIISYSLMTHLLAKHCDLIADEFIHFIGNAHIYEEHLDGVKEQLSRVPLQFPTINIIRKRENIEDYEFSDIEFTSPYCCLEGIKFKMIA